MSVAYDVDVIPDDVIKLWAADKAPTWLYDLLDGVRRTDGCVGYVPAALATVRQSLRGFDVYELGDGGLFIHLRER